MIDAARLRHRFAIVPALALTLAARAGSLIGEPAQYSAVEDDTLLDVARRYDLGYIELLLANPGVNPWLPGAQRQVVIPSQHLLPDAPHHGIVINLPELRLYYYPPGSGAPQSFPIGIGDEGKETPVGTTTIARKQVHPAWVPTASERVEDPDLPPVIMPGPDNPMGDYALYLGWKGYAIHGSDKPYSIGRRDSHGCIRMYPEDVETLFRQVRPGTAVMIVDQPVKTGWQDHQLYLEVHPALTDLDLIEAGGRARSIPPDAEAQVLEAAGLKNTARVNWSTVLSGELERSGIPQRITD